MASQRIKLTGTVEWAKVFLGMEDKKFATPEKPDGKYTIKVYPDAASLVLLKNSGSRKKATEDDKGASFIFDKDADVLIAPGPPIVGKGRNSDNSLIPFNGPIGNGSSCEIFVIVYDSKAGKGTRLEAINVLELVEYKKEPLTATNYKF